MTGTSNNAVKPPFLAFAADSVDLETLKTFAGARQWSGDGVHQGDIRTAIQFLKNNPSPVLLVVEIPSAKEAPALLDQLADVCDANTRVITIGAINEYSFYCWLMDIGIFSYLLKPLSVQALENAYQKSSQSAGASSSPEKTSGKVIAVMGARGGVGTTTISLNLAGVIAAQTGKPIALADIDPWEGSVALALDIEPSRGLREALERPDRIDALFIERVMTKPLKNLSVLSTEESLQDSFAIHDNAADALLRELRGAFAVTVLDIPRYLNDFSRECLKQADAVVLVTELGLAALRDTMRLSDLMRELLKMKPPVIVANRVGLAPKQEMRVEDFEHGINGKLAHRVPFAPDVFMQVSGEISAIKQNAHAAVKPIYALAAQLVPEAKGKEIPTKKNLLGFLSKPKKDEED